MTKDRIFKDLFTIEANIVCSELPKNFAYIWSEFNRFLSDESLNTNRITINISINGRLQSKCIFIRTQQVALIFKKSIEDNLKKKYPSIQINVRPVVSFDLDYRRKKALDEANENNIKIEKMISTI